jgi:hypothetical protein
MKLPLRLRWYEIWFLALQREHKLEALNNEMRERKFRELFAPQTQKINSLGYQDICNVNFVVYIEKRGLVLILYGNLETWLNGMVIIYFLTKGTVNSLDFLVSDSRTIVKRKWKRWGRKAVITQNEEQF